uniref:Uncharacterized protein n=1 Tax=Solanum lycopersicum TaxID=4081 RepID=A0A3Q7IN62_SOLLC
MLALEGWDEILTGKTSHLHRHCLIYTASSYLILYIRQDLIEHEIQERTYFSVYRRRSSLLKHMKNELIVYNSIRRKH